MFKSISRRHENVKVSAEQKEQALKEIEVKEPYLKDFTEVIEKVCKLLNIDQPKITFVPYIYDCKDGRFISKEWLDFTKGYGPIGGLYEACINTIVLAINNPITQNKLSDKELLFIVIHELRHVWQFHFQKEKYYKKDAIGMENFHDIAEIDADAFAMMIIKALSGSEDTSFSPDLSILIKIDNGKRKSRSIELEKQYLREIKSLPRIKIKGRG